MGFFKRKSDVFSSLIEGAEGVSYTSFYHDAFKRLRRDKVAMVCLACKKQNKILRKPSI